MGLDQYLRASVYVPRQDWSAFFAKKTTAADVAKNDQMQAALNDGLQGIAQMTIMSIPAPTREEPPIEEKWVKVHAAMGAPEQMKGDFDVRFEIHSWRKANQIHGWFERHVADGELQNVTDYTVEREQLEELRDACRRVLEASTWKNKLGGEVAFSDGTLTSPDDLKDLILESVNSEVALELLPPTEGFFFGDSALDEWYMQDVYETFGLLTSVLANPWLRENNASFIYRAWW